MRNDILKKGLVLGILLLFVTGGIVSALNAIPSNNSKSTSLSDVFYPTDDTMLDKGSSNPDSPDGSYLFMIIRNTYGSGGNDIFEADGLVKFDLSLLHNVLISSAKLYLYYYEWGDNNPSGRPLNLYRITSDWNEDTATWNNQPTYAPQPTTSATVPSTYGWMSWNVTSDVQFFINSQANNYGWKITDGTYWGDIDIPQIVFRTKEYGSLIPYLEIQIAPPSIVYVDDNFDSSTSGWGYDHFNVIQDGINAVSEGGTVYVYSGTYYENIVINRDSINLIGEDKEYGLNPFE